VLGALEAGWALPPESRREPPAFVLPSGLADMDILVGPDNPLTAGKIALGGQLFFDKRLSKTRAMSCETCHVPEKGWTDGLAFSTRHDGRVNSRSTPTLFGVAFYPDLYWDGRAKGLEAQILSAWTTQLGADPEAVAADLASVSGYRSAFATELGGPPTGDRVVKALASFVRTIQAGDTSWDRLDQKARDRSEAGRGFFVFSQVAHCTLCHLPPLYSDTLFHNVGIGSDRAAPDPGHGAGAFKTPSLRGVALTAPYFHDGRAKTLEEAVDLMLGGGIANPHLDPKLQPARLTPAQRADLIAFLKSLTPANRPYPRPTLP
jgi:cytochrome c peroxidase